MRIPVLNGCLVVMMMICTNGQASERVVATSTALRGLHGVYISIRQDGQVPGTRGLSDRDVWQEIVVRLRLAGLRVLTEDEWERTPGRPYLYLNLWDTALEGHGAQARGSVATCNLDLMQEVNLSRDPGVVVDACTWSRGATIVNPTRDREPLRVLIDRLASEFSEDVLKANGESPEHASVRSPLEPEKNFKYLLP